MAATCVFNYSPLMASYGGQKPLQIIDCTLTCASDGVTASGDTDKIIRGTIEKVEIFTASATSSSTVKVWETNSPLTSPECCVSYTTSTSVSVSYYPVCVPMTNANGSPATATNGKYLVCDQLHFELAASGNSKSVRVRLFVRG